VTLREYSSLEAYNMFFVRSDLSFLEPRLRLVARQPVARRAVVLPLVPAVPAQLPRLLARRQLLRVTLPSRLPSPRLLALSASSLQLLLWRKLDLVSPPAFSLLVPYYGHVVSRGLEHFIDRFE